MFHYQKLSNFCLKLINFGLYLKAVCWSSGINEKATFVLVKGNLQGAGKKFNIKHLAPICKYKFLENFKAILSKLQASQNESTNLSYSDAKILDINYNQSSIEFYKQYSDWIKTDRAKYYDFKLK